MMFLTHVLILISICHTTRGRGACDEYYSSYRGCKNTGNNGEMCANWEQIGLWGDEDFITRDLAQVNGVGNHDYCRNPGNKRYGPWCYQAGRGRTKIYCGVNSATCGYTRQDMDPSCPSRSQRVPTDNQRKEITQINVDIGSRVVLDCTCGEWAHVPENSRSYTASNGSRIVERAGRESAGDWLCSCTGVTYIRRLEVCQISWLECRQVYGAWQRSGRSHCKDIPLTEPCEPDNTSEEEDEEKEEQQREDNEPQREYPTADTDSSRSSMGDMIKPGARIDEECKGSGCSFCMKNPLLCGILGFCVAGVAAVVALFAKRALKWRKEARDARSVISTLTLKEGTLSAPSTGAYYKREPQYEQAIHLHKVLEQLQQSEMSRATSATDTLFLRDLRRPGGIGRIKSDESGSHENIKCESKAFRPPSLEFHMNEGSDDDEIEEEEFENLRDHDPVYRREDTNRLVEEDLEAADLTTQRNLPTNYDMGRAEDYGRERTDKDGTIFEKYFDSMSRWSIGTEMQI